jgi:hypothetical protein
MDHWQHLALAVERRYFGTMDNPYSDWVLVLDDGTEIQGMEPILDRYGGQGWELVSMVPTSWGKNEAQGLTAVFKRKGA